MKKKLHKVIRFQGARKNGKKTFMEFGWVENPTFENDVFFKIESAHKGGSGYWELRTDEALLFIHGLSMSLNAKNGLKIEKMF